MGMDVYGKSATSETGEYCRRNVWGWHPLASCICDLAPEETAGCTHWHSNDGDGLDAEGAIALADKLDRLIEAGAVDQYFAARDASVKALPRTKCIHCNGTGIRTDGVGEKHGMPDRCVPVEDGNPRSGLKGWCNGCNGWGSERPTESMYGGETSDVRQFAAFLRDSGGFEIH